MTVNNHTPLEDKDERPKLWKPLDSNEYIDSEDPFYKFKSKGMLWKNRRNRSKNR